MDELFNRVARRRRGGQRGFTLIELLVVIAVLAILAAIVIFNVLGVTNRGNQSSCQTDTKTVQSASDAYRNDTQKYPVAGGDVTPTVAGSTVSITELVPKYIHSAPGNGETFTFSDTNGTVAGAGPSGC